MATVNPTQQVNDNHMESEGPQLVTNVTVQAQPEAPAHSTHATGEDEVKKKAKTISKPKSKANSEVMQNAAGTGLTLVEPVFMRPSVAQISLYLAMVTQQLVPLIRGSTMEKLLPDVKALFAFNLQSRMCKQLEQYVPQGFKSVADAVKAPWTIVRLVDALLGTEPDRGIAPPILPDRVYIMDQLAAQDIVPPDALTLVGLLARWQQYETEITRSYSNMFVEKAGDSLLDVGVVKSGDASPQYNAVSRRKLTRSDELLTGMLRPRLFNEIAVGCYVPTLTQSELRSLPSLAGYFKAAEPYDEMKFALEFMMTAFRRA